MEESLERQDGYLQAVEWSFPNIIAVMAGFLGGGFVGSVVAIGLGWITVYADGSVDTTPAGLFLLFAFQALGGIGVLWYLSARHGTGSFATDFGFRLRPQDWWGIPAGAALQIAAALVVFPLIDLLFPDGPPEQSTVGITESAQDGVEILLILLTLVVLAPIVEELIFRGILLSRLVRSMSAMWAVVAMAAVFALTHYLGDPTAVAALPGLFLIALVLGYAAIRTGDLSLPIFLHAGVNLTAALLLIYEQDIINWLDEQGVESALAVIRALT